MSLWNKIWWFFRRRNRAAELYGLSGEIVSYQAVWEWKDANGNTHRRPVDEPMRVVKP